MAIVEELRKEPETSEEAKSLGNEYYKSGNYSVAVEYYTTALELCETEKDDLKKVYYANLAAALFKLGKYKEVVDACCQTLKLDEHYTKARLRRAAANEQINNSISLRDAVGDLEICARSDPLLEKELRPRILDLQRLQMKTEEKEREELLGKAKDLGNSILGKFGMSLDNFKSDGKGGFTFAGNQ